MPLLLFLSYILGTATDSVYLVAREGRGRELNFSKQDILPYLAVTEREQVPHRWTDLFGNKQ